MFYEVIINRTSKVGKDDFTAYDQVRKTFQSRWEVAEFLGHEYYYVRATIPAYQDNYQGKVGIIYCWKEKENGKTIYCRDWVSVYKTVREPVLVRRNRR